MNPLKKYKLLIISILYNSSFIIQHSSFRKFLFFDLLELLLLKQLYFYEIP